MKSDLVDEVDALRDAGRCGAKNTVRWRCAVCEVYPRRSELADGACPRCAGEVAEVPVGKYRFCHRWPRRGRERCDQHGGKSPIGPAAAAWGSGRGPAGKHSRILSGRYAEAYERAMRQEGVPHLLEQIALSEARERELVEQIQAAATSGGSWANLAAVYAALADANRAGDVAAFGEALDRMGEVISSGMDLDATWGRWMELAESRRKLVATQRQLVAAGEGFVSVGELLAFAARIVDAIRRHVPDRRAVDAMVTEIDLVLTGGEVKH